MTKLPSMIVRSSHLRPIPSFLLPFTQSTPASTSQTRKLHSGNPGQQTQRLIPKRTPFVPDTQTFLTLIGRNLTQYASKIPTWESLFTLNSVGLKQLGIESPRTRRYLQAWRTRYRQGHHGPGGNLPFVKDGVALLKIVDVPVSRTAKDGSTLPPTIRKMVVNIPSPGGSAENVQDGRFQRVEGFPIKNRTTITGPHVQQLKGNLAQVEVAEGLWEFKRGRKIDGGERRQAEVRAKRRGEEKRAAAEKAR